MIPFEKEKKKNPLIPHISQTSPPSNKQSPKTLKSCQCMVIAPFFVKASKATSMYYYFHYKNQVVWKSSPLSSWSTVSLTLQLATRENVLVMTILYYNYYSLFCWTVTKAKKKKQCSSSLDTNRGRSPLSLSYHAVWPTFLRCFSSFDSAAAAATSREKGRGVELNKETFPFCSEEPEFASVY